MDCFLSRIVKSLRFYHTGKLSPWMLVEIMRVPGQVIFFFLNTNKKTSSTLYWFACRQVHARITTARVDIQVYIFL
jgi:hypothetical protein